MEKKCRIVLVAVCLLAAGWLLMSAAQEKKTLPGITPGIKPKITAELKAFPASYNGYCPTTITFKGKITVPGPMTVKYKFIRSDGAIAPEQTLVFSAPGSKAVSTGWTIGKSYSGWQAIEILAPVTLTSNQAHFTITCKPKPNITSLSQFHYGMPHPQIDLHGTDFGSVQGAKILLIDGNPVSVISWGDSMLNFSQTNIIPWEHTYKYSISENGTVISNVLSKRLLYSISHHDPSAGAPANGEFSLHVFNLPPAPGGLEVRLDKHVCPVILWNGGTGGTIKARVPPTLALGDYELALWKRGVKVSKGHLFKVLK